MKWRQLVVLWLTSHNKACHMLQMKRSGLHCLYRLYQWCSQSCHPLSTLTNGALPPIILFILLWMVCLFSRQPATFFPEVMLTECSIPLAPLLCWVVVRLSKKSKGNFEQYFHDNVWGLFWACSRLLRPLVDCVSFSDGPVNMLSSPVDLSCGLCPLCFLLLPLPASPFKA